jgi:uncharacterized repeat protein (TIGR01451 family)
MPLASGRHERNAVYRSVITSLAAAAAIAVFGPASAAFASGGTATGADLQTSGSASSGSVHVGDSLNYTFQLKNSGPQDAAGATFSDQLPSGMTFLGASVAGARNSCTGTDSTNGTLVTCDLGTLLKAGQATISVGVKAPQIAGTYANTGTASSSTTDPQPSNNSAGVSVKVQPLPTCTLPSGQTTRHGVVMAKYTNSSGLFEDFLFQVNGQNYYVKTNFYDGTQPLTSIINLLCKPVTTVFVQGGEQVDVTGTDTGSTITLPGTTASIPVIDAAVIQVPFTFDKAV